MRILCALFTIFVGCSALCGATVDSMKAEISEKSQIEDVIASLPLDLRSRFTFVYSGHALIEANEEFPSAILFGQSARTLIAFGGSSNLAGFNVIDVLEFNDHLGRYEPFRFFYNPSSKDKADASALEQIGKSKIYFEAKPQACNRCHGPQAHPIFEVGYPEWKGFYGSDRDHLFSSFNRKEADAYRHFLNNGKRTPRYEALVFPDFNFSVMSPFLDETTEKKVGYPNSLIYRPNLFFGAQIARLNAIGVYKKLKESAHFLRYSALLAFLLQKCDTVTLDPKKLASTIDEIDRLGNEIPSFQNLKLKSSSLLGNEMVLNKTVGAKLIALMGVTEAHWNLANVETAKTSEYGYWSGYGDIYEFVHAQLVGDLFANVDQLYSATDFQVPYLSEFARVLVPKDHRSSCQMLAKRANLAF